MVNDRNACIRHRGRGRLFGIRGGSTARKRSFPAASGRKSLSDADMRKNFDALIDAVIKSKPSGSKGKYVRKVAISSSMDPDLKVYLADVAGA